MNTGHPKHNDPIPFDKGKWVPVGWKALNTSAKTRQSIMNMIAKRKSEAHNKESQRNAQKKRKEEKRELKRKAIEELDRIEKELIENEKKKEELAQTKHKQFGTLKVIFQREAQLKKIEEERRRKDEALNQILNPAYSQALKQPAAQSNSLISQQFLAAPQVQQYQQPQSQAIHQANQAFMHSQLLQSLKHQQLQQHQLQQAAKLAQQPQTPQMRNTLIPPPAPSPFFAGGSNYTSPAPSRNLIPPQSVNSPRRDRPPMSSPSAGKFAPQTQSRHNSFVGGARPELRAAESPAISANSQINNMNLAELQQLAFQQNLSRISGFLPPQHQPTPPPQGMRR